MYKKKERAEIEGALKSIEYKKVRDEEEFKERDRNKVCDEHEYMKVRNKEEEEHKYEKVRNKGEFKERDK